MIAETKKTYYLRYRTDEGENQNITVMAESQESAQEIAEQYFKQVFGVRSGEVIFRGLIQEEEVIVKAHVCDLPDSIKEALNSGDGTYRP